MYLYLIPIIIHALALGIAYEGGSTRQRIGVYCFIILIFVVGLFINQIRTSNIEPENLFSGLFLYFKRYSP